ncbi:hypothetical protein LCGC14_1290900 [marine sediment metagenome]|uniref:Uncharacterized protein n=1 Tax=marine sediment metagenome TaxID=412755 RepID=A0A0F9NVD2_9ZZZZ
MADLILTWHIPGVLSETGVAESNTGVEYTLDKDYVPERVILRLKTAAASSGTPCTIDINDDGSSIFDVNPTIGQGLTEVVWDSFASSLIKMKKDSVITLDIDQISSTTYGRDLTVQLDLKED